MSGVRVNGSAPPIVTGAPAAGVPVPVKLKLLSVTLWLSELLKFKAGLEVKNRLAVLPGVPLSTLPPYAVTKFEVPESVAFQPEPCEPVQNVFPVAVLIEVMFKTTAFAVKVK